MEAYLWSNTYGEALMEWKTPDTLDEVKDGEVIMISHNRGTWDFPQDQKRITCVVVYRHGDIFKPFGPDVFPIREVAAWARFDEPPVDIARKTFTTSSNSKGWIFPPELYERHY